MFIFHAVHSVSPVPATVHRDSVSETSSPPPASLWNSCVLSLDSLSIACQMAQTSVMINNSLGQERFLKVSFIQEALSQKYGIRTPPYHLPLPHSLFIDSAAPHSTQHFRFLCGLLMRTVHMTHVSKPCLSLLVPLWLFSFLSCLHSSTFTPLASQCLASPISPVFLHFLEIFLLMPLNCSKKTCAIACT